MTASYRLNLRVFWPLVTCGCSALLGLLQALRSRGVEDGAPVPLPRAWLLPLLLAGLLLAGLACVARRGPLEQRRAAAGGRAARRRRRRAALEAFYEQQLRISPHVLGHSKAHVSLVVGEVVRAGKAPARLALRGDFVQVGSAYEQHKVRSPDAFDVLLPLRLPAHLQLRALRRPEQPDCRGTFACALEVGPAAALSEALCMEEAPSAGGSGACRQLLSAALVLRWFQSHVQRSLGAVRSRLQERCRVSLAVGPGRPLTLHITPCSDYICCHLSMAVRLIPAVPLGEALYLTPLPIGTGAIPQAPPGIIWTFNVAKQEQRLLAWLREQGPPDACHLKCLQLLKGLRDLGARALEPPLSTQWSRVLSSPLLKTALLALLLRGPLTAWEDRFLVERMEDLVLFLVDGLQQQRLMHLFLGNPSLPEALSLPKVLKDAPRVNLLADFDRPTLSRVAAQLLDIWKQAPKVMGMYSGHRYWKKHPV